MFSFLKGVKSAINKVFCFQAGSEQTTPQKSNPINSTVPRGILNYAYAQQESIFCEIWRDFMRYPVLYELSLNCGLPEEEVWKYLEGLLNEIEKEIRMKNDARKLLQEVTNSFVLKNIVFFIKRRNGRLAELKLTLHEFECEIFQNLRNQYRYVPSNELDFLHVTGILNVKLIGCHDLLESFGGSNTFTRLGGDIRAVIKLDNIKVVETPWRPYSRRAWNYCYSIDMYSSRILEINILWRDLRSLCGVKFFRLEPLIDGKLHRWALELEPKGCLHAEFQLISQKCDGN